MERANERIMPARKPDCAHHQRKAHDGAGERSSCPSERKHDAEMLIEEGADRAFAAEGDEEEIARDDGG
jgi:hypothetical protein